jgi:hypothetical protein
MHRSLVALALAVCAAAPAAAVRQDSALVRLEAPRAGEVLTGGATAELAWVPRGPFERLDHVEEWEAFLSFDGGATYPVRITPHLDLDLRRIRWQVPSIPTRDARLLLRFGDERRETYVELPQRFVIAEAPWAAPPLFDGAKGVHRVATRGEPALPGRPGVVAWVEGSRRGGSLRPVVANETPDLRESIRTPVSHSEAAVLGSEDRPDGPPAPAATSGGKAAPLPGRPLAAAGGRSFLASLDILLLTQRQNE